MHFLKYAAGTPLTLLDAEELAQTSLQSEEAAVYSGVQI